MRPADDECAEETTSEALDISSATVMLAACCLEIAFEFESASEGTTTETAPELGVERFLRLWRKGGASVWSWPLISWFS